MGELEAQANTRIDNSFEEDRIFDENVSVVEEDESGEDFNSEDVNIREVIIDQIEKDLDAVTSLNILKSRISQTVDKQRISQFEWSKINAKYTDYEEAYHEIAPELTYFDINEKERFIDQTKAKFNELIQIFPDFEGSHFWNDIEMENMFGKGLNPTSLISTQETANWFAAQLKTKDEIVDVAEVGIGAGWSTTMLYDALEKRYPDKRKHIFASDISLHAIGATQVLLESKGIDYLLVQDAKHLETLQRDLEETDFSGVILIPGSFVKTVDWFGDNSLEGLYSSHGSAYLSEDEYSKVLNVLRSKMQNGGLLIADSLNPLYTNELSKPVMIMQMIAPKLMKKILDRRGVKHIFSSKTKTSQSKYFHGQESKIIKVFNTPRPYLILHWCNYLLRKGKVKRVLDTVKSLSITMSVVDRYRDDVYPSFMLAGLIKKENAKTEDSQYSVLEEGKPEDFEIFMDTIGLRLYK